MRRLGHDHFITLFAPLEVDQQIRVVSKKSSSDSIDVLDVLLWTLSETCAEIRHNAVQWALQGLDHTSRSKAWASYSRGFGTRKKLEHVQTHHYGSYP